MRVWTMRAAAVALFATVAAPAQAGTVNPFTSLWVLGDSLSDPGNLFDATKGKVPPSPPYFQGRFSNGPVWAEHFAAGFLAEGRPVGNVAFGGAQALPNDDDVPDLPFQLGLTALGSRGRLGDRPLAALWFGANDLLAAIGTPGQTRAARRAANAVAAGVVALALIGIEDTLVFNLPDLGRVPAFNLFQPQAAPLASAATRTFNTVLDRRLDRLRSAGLGVREVDIFATFNDVLENPGRYGIANTVLPCVFPPAAGGSVCSPTEAMLRAFFDPVHPNAVLHREIAALATRAASPIPLPASAWLIIGALGLLAYQRRARRPTSAPATATTRIASTYQTA